MSSVIKILLSSVFLSVISFQLFAADKAILIGVGQHKNPAYNLPGIDFDLMLFQQSLIQLGVKKSDMLVLKGKQATKDNIKRTVNTHFKNIKRGDRVFSIYLVTALILKTSMVMRVTA